jgi:hypothetical protein
MYSRTILWPWAWRERVDIDGFWAFQHCIRRRRTASAHVLGFPDSLVDVQASCNGCVPRRHNGFRDSTAAGDDPTAIQRRSTSQGSPRAVPDYRRDRYYTFSRQFIDTARKRAFTIEAGQLRVRRI